MLRDAVGQEPRVPHGGSVRCANCVALAAKPHVDGFFVGPSAGQPQGLLGIAGQVLGG